MATVASVLFPSYRCTLYIIHMNQEGVQKHWDIVRATAISATENGEDDARVRTS